MNRVVVRCTLIVAALSSTFLITTISVPTMPTMPTVSAATKVDPIRILNSLPVSVEAGSGYNRELFRHWSDLDGDGCDTREEVLIDERVSGDVRGCKVINGTWYSIFDGEQTNNASTFDIDHFVPLKEAWDSGAWRWDSDTRQRFANDLGYAAALVAVTASSNRSKSDRDPADWLPQRERCAYARSWVGVKFRWRLSVDSTEKRALTGIFQNCKGKMAVPSRAAIGTSSSAEANPSAPSKPTQLDSTTDPRYSTCGEAISAGYGPYQKGKDPEYEWYIDRDSDGFVCE
jgi:hypothetical protein